ncbi:MAG: hypothetical protein AMXMBFR13_42120 [Phycisphaerae bacterium]
MRAIDRSRILEQLENDVWGEPDVSSGLISRCHGLRKKPGQSISLEFLIPLAIERYSACQL